MHAPETSIYTAIILAVLVIAGVVCYFFHSTIRQHKRVLFLQRENATAEITALEKDRSRIAADLHDELAPMLVAIKMKINSFDLENENDRLHLHSVNHTIDELARRMRGISFDLMPSALKEKGLQTAIQEFVGMVSGKTQLHIQFSASEGPLDLTESITIHLYRIVQEIIHNTVKHANAKKLYIVIRRENHYLVIASRDNGAGFDYEEKLKQAQGLGLRSLMNRVYLINGEFLIESKAGVGTAITIQIPI